MLDARACLRVRRRRLGIGHGDNSALHRTIPVVPGARALASPPPRRFSARASRRLAILEGSHVAGAACSVLAGAMGERSSCLGYVNYAVDGDGDGAPNRNSMPDASPLRPIPAPATAGGLAAWALGDAAARLRFPHPSPGFARGTGSGCADRPRPCRGGMRPSCCRRTARAACLVTRLRGHQAYNSSDAMHRGRPLATASMRPAFAGWPRTRPSRQGQREEVQRRLARLGFYGGDVDGRLGSQTREAVRRFQLRRGLAADGYADRAVLRELRAVR